MPCMCSVLSNLEVMGRARNSTCGICQPHCFEVAKGEKELDLGQVAYWSQGEEHCGQSVVG